MRSTPAKVLVSGFAYYDEPTGTGKTTAHTDTYHGEFVKLVPNEQVVEVVEFETTDPAMQGEMTISICLFFATYGVGDWSVDALLRRTRTSGLRPVADQL